MNIFDVIGPIMVGPSSSHTAGAVRIGYICRKLLGEEVKEVIITLHGSFAHTGKGHGTDKALLAGLMLMSTDDIRIADSMNIAKSKGINYEFINGNLGEVHPNSVKLELSGKSERVLTITASSLGGGRICVNSIDGLDVNFEGNYPTLIVHNEDQPGHVADVTSMLSHKSVNIASMQLFRSSRGKEAVMVIECDQEIPKEGVKWLKNVEGVNKVTYLSLED